MNEVVKSVRSRYRERWGEPAREAEFSAAGDVMEIYKWDASPATEGVELYATLGASTQGTPGMEPSHRVEYFLVLAPGRDEVAPELARLGFYNHHEQTFLAHGHTLSGHGPVWPGTTMDSFLVLTPMVEMISALVLPGGVHVEFLQAVPLYPSERAFKVQHGVEALLSLWQKTEVPFWDPRRRAEPDARRR